MKNIQVVPTRTRRSYRREKSGTIHGNKNGPAWNTTNWSAQEDRGRGNILNHRKMYVIGNLVRKKSENIIIN